MEHSCGYVTLLDLDVSRLVDDDGSGERKNLIEEELDIMDQEEKNDFSLDLDVSKTKKKSKNYVILDINFGVPLFDANLNRQICGRIVSNGLWKKERCVLCTDFLYELT